MFDIDKILGTKKNQKQPSFSNMSLSQTFGKNPFSNMIGKLTKKPLRNMGASKFMQNKWDGMNHQQRNFYRRKYKDTDGDRIPNMFDCQPQNIMRQHRYTDITKKGNKIIFKNPEGKKIIYAGKTKDPYKEIKESKTKENKNEDNLFEPTTDDVAYIFDEFSPSYHNPKTSIFFGPNAPTEYGKFRHQRVSEVFERIIKKNKEALKKNPNAEFEKKSLEAAEKDYKNLKDKKDEYIDKTSKISASGMYEMPNNKGQSAIFLPSAHKLSSGYEKVKGTAIHEIGHDVDKEKQITSADVKENKWDFLAMTAPTYYGETNIDEDFAESFKQWHGYEDKYTRFPRGTEEFQQREDVLEKEWGDEKAGPSAREMAEREADPKSLAAEGALEAYRREINIPPEAITESKIEIEPDEESEDKMFVAAGKKIVVLDNPKKIPSKKVIKDVYGKINDDVKIPVKFMKRERYLKEYIKNQEKAKNYDFPEIQEKEYINTEMPIYKNILSRYTTKDNKYYEPAVIYFNDKKISDNQFKKLALHEYGHEFIERNNIKMPKHREEMFCDAVMNKKIVVDEISKNKKPLTVFSGVPKNSDKRVNVEAYSLAQARYLNPTFTNWMPIGYKQEDDFIIEEENINPHIEQDGKSKNLIQSLWYAGDKAPSETLKEQGRVYGFSSKEYADGWREKKGKQNIYQFTADEYDLDDKTYIRDTPQGKKYNDNEYIVKSVLDERIHKDEESENKLMFKYKNYDTLIKDDKNLYSFFKLKGYEDRINV